MTPCLVAVFAILSSCQKEDDFDTDSGSKLEFSSDSIVFDTVFTTLGSTTRYLMVYNNSRKPISISSIKLESGDASQYTVNVDGQPGAEFHDIEIDGKDSIFIFIKVRIDPTSQNSPLVVGDRLLFETNGNAQSVELVAWGQDAHYIVANRYVNGLPPYRIVAAEGQTTVWTNDKPYVVYGYAVVDSTGKLIVQEGVRVHFHKGSGLWVYKGGSLQVNGSLENPVYFQGDRLEQAYQDIPGQWDRIWLNEGSIDNVFNYAVIQNGFIGLQTETLQESMGNKLNLGNTIIRNMTGWGVFSRFYKIDAWNCEISNCGIDAVYLSRGGSYDFRHCTLGDYWSYSIRQTPALLVSNFYKDAASQVTYLGDLSKAYFGNCIIYGNLESEILLEKYNEPTLAFNYHFDHCIYKSKTSPDSVTSCWRNLDPLFFDLEKRDFSLKEDSPAIGKGDPLIADEIPNDIRGNPRLPLPDLGAYQYKPEK